MSVTEMHWRIIANLGFKFRSKFTAHCGRGIIDRKCGGIISSPSHCQALLFKVSIRISLHEVSEIAIRVVKYTYSLD